MSFFNCTDKKASSNTTPIIAPTTNFPFFFAIAPFNRRFPPFGQAVNPLADLLQSGLAESVTEDASKKDRIYANPIAQIGGFVFDDSVAAVFSDMIVRSVPGYTMTLSLMPLIGQRYARPQSCVYDLGCSLGAGILAISSSLPQSTTIVGIDNSQPMLDRCKSNLEDSIECRNWSLKCEDILDTRINNASIVILNFTLQFVPLEKRLALIRRISEGLRPGGALLLSEKIRFDEKSAQRDLTDLHHRFKIANGYSDLEVSQKRSSLENILVPETIFTHKSRLKEAGFDHSEVWLQCFNFASLLAIKAE